MKNQAHEPLPNFKYHPDPLATGMLRESNETCVVCARRRGYVYVGSVAAIEEYIDEICPWCIADGSAHTALDATFTNHVGGHRWEEVPKSIEDEVRYRTPSYNSWQAPKWFTHCGDAGAFLGAVGHKELEELGPEAIQAILDDTGISDDAEWEWFYRRLDKDGSPTAYIFRCLHCGKFDGYTDCD